jgi:hypothetical protein
MQQSSGGHQNQLPGMWEKRLRRRAVGYLAWGCLADGSVSAENRYRRAGNMADPPRPDPHA